MTRPKDSSAPHTSSCPTSLRDPTTYITGHNQDNGTAIYHSANPATWQNVLGTNFFIVVYTTSAFPVDMNANEDVTTHESILSSGKLGLVRANGTVCRTVDFAPQGEALMHRTKSLDYGIVVEGEIECHLDSGEVQVLKRGDVAVQRGSMHAWRNASQDEWARMVFVLQDCLPVRVAGKELGEELGHRKGGVPGSGN